VRCGSALISRPPYLEGDWVPSPREKKTHKKVDFTSGGSELKGGARRGSGSLVTFPLRSG